MSTKQTPNYTFALIIVIAVCFLIGFVTTMNNSMIEFCKKAFDLSDAQGQLVNTAFYGAYAMSIPFGFMMSKIGYKKTLILGLAVVGLGFIINWAAISTNLQADTAVVYAYFLGSMFVVALGIVMLQLVANPYVMVLGAPEGGAFRMTLSQALNSVATTLAPIFIGSVIIAGQIPTPAAVPAPYLGLGIFTLLLCVILVFLKLPEIKEEEQAEAADGVEKEYKSSVFKYPHVWFGALGIFFYMGLEIGIPSMLPAYFKANPDLGITLFGTTYNTATDFLTFYWGGMMVGRFIGAAVLSKFQPRVLLTFCLAGGAICVGTSFLLSGMASVFCMLAAGLFHSVMWPLVFNLGLQELGPHTKAASGIINLGVVGAATLTPLMGLVVDTPSLGVGVAICMMFIYYLYVAWFCWKGSKVGLK
jgi:FHS family L-fucose permease-like MFS transporter